MDEWRLTVPQPASGVHGWLEPLPQRRSNPAVLAVVAIAAVASLAFAASRGAAALRRDEVHPGAERAGYGGRYAFLLEHADDTPVRWSSCQPIRYVLNLAAAPPSARADIDAAISRVSASTGLRFQFAGMTDEQPSIDRPVRQPERYGDDWAPVLITWSSIRAAGMAPPEGAALGVGLASYVERSGQPVEYVSGQVVIDSGYEWRAGFSGALSTGPVLLHEIGHLLGLGHVHDQMQLMQEGGDARLHLLDYGTGDLEGLAALGGPCTD